MILFLHLLALYANYTVITVHLLREKLLALEKRKTLLPSIIKMQISSALQGSFVKNHLAGAVLEKIKGSLLKNQTAPKKEEMYKILEKYYAQPQGVMLQISTEHLKIGLIPNINILMNKGTPQGTAWQRIHQATQAHLRLLESAYDLGLATNLSSTAYTFEYIRVLLSLIPANQQDHDIALTSDPEERFNLTRDLFRRLEGISEANAVLFGGYINPSSTFFANSQYDGNIEVSHDPQHNKIHSYPLSTSANVNKTFLSQITQQTACKICHQSHLTQNCPEVICHKCNRKGHFKSSCTEGTRSQSIIADPVTKLLCLVCRQDSKMKNLTPIPTHHPLSSKNKIITDCCPLLLGLDIPGKMKLIRDLNICFSCLRVTSEHQSSYGYSQDLNSCGFLQGPLQFLQCKHKGCKRRNALCDIHINDNLSVLQF